MSEPRAQNAGVLRDVPLHAQPITLRRAVRGTSQPESRAAVDEVPRESVEDAIARSRAEGIAQGRAEEMRARQMEWDRMLADAKSQAQDEGRALGVEQGMHDAAERALQAREELERDLRDRIARLGAVVASAEAAVQAWRTEEEEDLVALSFEIACRVLGPRATERQALEQMTRHVLREHGSRSALAVHVHPDDFECIAHEEPRANARWEWVSDPAVQAGGVLLRSPQGSLDARIDTQLRVLGEVLVAHRDERKRQQGEGAP